VRRGVTRNARQNRQTFFFKKCTFW
jgi:hypothetical protein